MTASKNILPGIDLGQGERGEQRRAVLREMADRAGCFHAGASSIGKMIAAMADRVINARKRLPGIQVVSATTRRLDNLGIKTALGTLDIGYCVDVVLQCAEKTVTVEAVNALVTAEQTDRYCKSQCQSLIDRLSEQDRFSPGEIILLTHCRDRDMWALGLRTPPRRKHASEEEMLEYHAQTGRGGIYIQNELYREWAREYNQWIVGNQDYAIDYGCTLKDENYIMVK